MRSTEIIRLQRSAQSQLHRKRLTDVVADVAVNSPPACTPSHRTGDQASCGCRRAGRVGTGHGALLQVPGEVHQGGDAITLPVPSTGFRQPTPWPAAQTMPPGIAGLRNGSVHAARPRWCLGLRYLQGWAPASQCWRVGGRREGPGTSSTFLAAWPGRVGEGLELAPGPSLGSSVGREARAIPAFPPRCPACPRGTHPIPAPPS